MASMIAVFLYKALRPYKHTGIFVRSITVDTCIILRYLVVGPINMKLVW